MVQPDAGFPELGVGGGVTCPTDPAAFAAAVPRSGTAPGSWWLLRDRVREHRRDLRVVRAAAR